MDLGVYVHFPWCRARCPYCDFAIAIAPLEEIPHDRYADHVLAELAARAPLFPGRTLRSIYFGGGTPALWQPTALARVIGAVKATWPDTELAQDQLREMEITVEANPLDCTDATLGALRGAGVNRLSIGAQSFDDGDLVSLGRDHDGARSLAAVATARRAGFDAVSLDLIYALPGRTVADWRRTLDRAIAAAPDHMSVYQLTIETGTSFGEAVRKGSMQPAPDELSADLFEEAHARLTAAGWEHYEVSSYARPGRRARHNSSYWSGAEYLGLGNGAHSFWRPAADRGVRWAAHRSVIRWLSGTPSPPTAPEASEFVADELVAEVIEQDAAALAEDALWLGLRTSDGVPRAALAGREAALALLATAGWVTVGEDRVRPTPTGLLFADEIAARLLQSAPK